MTKEEILKDDFVANHYGDRARNWVDPAFLDGAEWMREKLVKRAVEWLENEMWFIDNSSSRGSFGEVRAMGIYDSMEEFIDDFRRAMTE